MAQLSLRGADRLAHPNRGTITLACLSAIVVAQVLINYQTWLVSGPDHLYYLRGLNTHPLPYIDARIEYPVLTGVFMTVAAALTHGLRDFLRLNSLLLGVCAVGCTWTFWSIARRAAWTFALSPLLLVYSLANWDLFAILLMLLGWRAYTRDHHGAAGLWLALGVFAKLFPIFLLGGCLLALLKRWHTRRDRPARDAALRFIAAAILTSLVVNLPFVIAAFHNWSFFWTFNADRTNHADLLSLLHIFNAHTSMSTMNLVLALITGTGIAAGVVAIWRGTPVAPVAALVFVVFMVMEKVYSPQYTLWVFVYGLLAEWDLWALVGLMLIGLSQDGAAAASIALKNFHPTTPATTLGWFDRNILVREQILRLGGLLVVGAAMLARELLPAGLLERIRSPEAAPTGADGEPRPTT